jgi:uncharacterized OB-fold protein
MKDEIMRRKVVSYENYIDPHARGTQGSNVLLLECGHKKRQKGSVKIPKAALCQECKAWDSGFVTEKTHGQVLETWDAVNKAPVFTRIEGEE